MFGYLRASNSKNTPLRKAENIENKLLQFYMIGHRFLRVSVSIAGCVEVDRELWYRAFHSQKEGLPRHLRYELARGACENSRAGGEVISGPQPEVPAFKAFCLVTRSNPFIPLDQLDMIIIGNQVTSERGPEPEPAGSVDVQFNTRKWRS